MHGAGLGHIVYLQPDAIVVEIKGTSMREKKLFLNMASKHDIGYYMFDALKAADTTGIHLQESQMVQFRVDLTTAWIREEERQSNDKQMAKPYTETENQCLFPRYQSSVQLSTYNDSRCYLELLPGTNDIWRQCPHYKECGSKNTRGGLGGRSE